MDNQMQCVRSWKEVELILNKPFRSQCRELMLPRQEGEFLDS